MQSTGVWVCLSKRSPIKITGIVIDAVIYREHNIVRDIGTTGEVESTGGTVIPTHCPELERPYNDELSSEELKYYYHTSGSLEHVANIRARKLSVPDGDFAELLDHSGSDRMVGLQITHHNGLVDTLGHWDSEDPESIIEIFDCATHGDLEILEFRSDVNIEFQIYQITARKRSALDPDEHAPIISKVIDFGDTYEATFYPAQHVVSHIRFPSVSRGTSFSLTCVCTASRLGLRDSQLER
jgi:hypothetical protein